MGSAYDWSTTAGSNGNSDASINFAEGQLPPTLNNSARAVMARVAALLKQLGAAITHGGSSNAYTLTLPSGHQITSYATGMRFLWKPNGNSSGSVTLNVDGVGAKKVFLSDGTTQAGSGHILSGRLLDVAYDATLDSAAGGFQIIGSLAIIGAQPLDATLTALAALSWSSGNALVQFTAADTVSLTLTPSVTDLTFSGVINAAAGSASLPAYTFTGDPDTGMYSGTANSIRFATNGTLRTTINNTGFVISSGVLSLLDGAVGAPGITFASDTDNGFYRIGANNWAGSVGGTKFLDIAATVAEFDVCDLRIEPTPAALATNSAGFLGVPLSRAVIASATLALSDAGKYISIAMSAGSQTVTIPPNSSVGFPIGSVVVLRAPSGNTFTVIEGSGVTLARADGTAGTGTRTVTANSTVTLFKVGTNEWEIMGPYT